MKTALVTGASSGIGAQIAERLSKDGYHLILMARREDRLQQTKNKLSGEAHILCCDINDTQAVDSALESLPAEFQNIDVLVNNAGLALGLNSADKVDWLDWQTMIQTNCMGLAYMTQKILPQMTARNTGHIINLGSTAGHYNYFGGNVYGATKAFVDHLSMSLRSDLLGTNIRVSNIIPGLLGETEFSQIRFHGDSLEADKVYDGYDALVPEDIAETVAWVLAQPARVNVNRIEIMPTCQAPAGLAVVRNQD